MKLTVDKETIIDGLQKAANIIPPKAGAAYLRSIWLNAANGVLSIMATDASLEFTGTYRAEISEPGLTGVQGRMFVDLVKQLPDGPFNLVLDENETVMRLEQGRRSYKLPVASKEWFQPLSALPEKEGVIWTGSVFSDYIERVAYCISEDEPEDPLGCLCLKPKGDGKIDMCGLNGHQFALVSFINDGLAEILPEKGLLLQRKYLADIRKWLPDDEIEVRLTDKRLYLTGQEGTEILTVPRVIRDYPDYSVFMDKLKGPDLSHLVLPRKDACETLGRLEVFNSTQDASVGMELQPNEVKLSVQGGDQGSARENLEATYDGNLERIAFPTSNLLEIFNHFLSDTVTMSFTGLEGPCGINADEDVGYLVIIMPMKASSGSYYSDDE